MSKTFPIVETPSIALDGRVWQNDSWVIFCGSCGAVWARRFLIDTPDMRWKIRIWPCKQCGNGSLWDAWNEPWNRSLPPELLHRELDIVKDWWDEGIRTYSEFFKFKSLRRTLT